ncbi:hypothetical protein NPIL_137371 [Nephila pilipes]|uniref:Uncharacterized protein n=1 Tax=Nephila pilipes TaxID=299642 RepID=A0A8X6PFC2_NEPPI|nr:hypothetical protein NPIL_137371 [Nephila pilipes]
MSDELVDKGENYQFLMDNDIIEEVTSLKEDEENDETGEVMTYVQKIPHNAAIDYFVTCIILAEENSVTMSDILVLM